MIEARHCCIAIGMLEVQNEKWNEKETENEIENEIENEVEYKIEIENLKETDKLDSEWNEPDFAR